MSANKNITTNRHKMTTVTRSEAATKPNQCEPTTTCMCCSSAQSRPPSRWRNARPSSMAGAFMARKKKYKFQVQIWLDELLEVPFVSAVLFAKLRLLDGGSFQETGPRQEVHDHRVRWDAAFAFPCKMLANAGTGVMERCVLRVSVRKECKGGRSFHKLGFVDVNLAEYAGAGLARRKALLEGYDTRHRQDNSILKFRVQMNMVAGDILFKAPTPSGKHEDVTAEEEVEELAPPPVQTAGGGGSLAGSVASGSSGFGSLPKKRPQLLTSELVAGSQQQQGGEVQQQHTMPEATQLDAVETQAGHSRNSSNTSQLSRVSGYASLHSRQGSSGGDSNRRRLASSTPKTDKPHASQTFHTPRGLVLRVQFERDPDADAEFRTPPEHPPMFVLRKSPSAGLVAPGTRRDGNFVPPTFLTPKPPRRCRSTGPGPPVDACLASLAGFRNSCGPSQPTPSTDLALPQDECAAPPGRVEVTRVDTDVVIEELLKSTNLDQADDSAETSGLQLFIAKDGTAALGNHEVKQQMGAGTQLFQQVVLDAQDR